MATMADVAAGGSVNDTAYGAAWDGDTTTAPSRNALYDKIESLGSAGEANVNADWNESNTGSDAYIQNKPTTISSGQASAITANTGKRTYPSADETKLAGIDANATNDQTPIEIKTAYESNTDTNAYTDTEKTTVGNTSGINTGDQDLSNITAVSVAFNIAVTEDFTALQIGYINASGAALANASTEATANGLLAASPNAATTGSVASFVVVGPLPALSHGFTIGAPLYLSTTSGSMTNTPPSTSGQIVRIVGYALTEHIIYFKGDNTFLEI